MQRLAIVAGVALLVLALFVGIASRGKDSEEAKEVEPRTNLAPASKANRAAAAERSGKSSRSRNSREPVAPIYSGPSGIAGWLPARPPKDNSEPPWRFLDGKLVSSRRGGIAREIATPSRSKLSFHLEWSNGLRFRILWGSDDGDTTQPNNAYDLVAQRRFVYLRKRWMTKESGGSRIVGQATVAALAENEEAFFEFYLDRESGLITLYVNGERAHAWTDADPEVGMFGDWLHFISEDFYPLQVSQLKVESWNGFLPDGSSGEELVEEQEARREWVQTLKPVAPWAPESDYREAAGLAHRLRSRAARTNEPVDQAAAAEAAQASAEAKIRYDQAKRELPVAEADPQRPGHVINPYTGQSLDRRGVRPGIRIRDPNDSEGERTFFVP